VYWIRILLCERRPSLEIVGGGGGAMLVERLPGFMSESKILLGKMVCSSFQWDLSV
jgi:hypothetical protein